MVTVNSKSEPGDKNKAFGFEQNDSQTKTGKHFKQKLSVTSAQKVKWIDF